MRRKNTAVRITDNGGNEVFNAVEARKIRKGERLEEI